MALRSIDCHQPSFRMILILVCVFNQEFLAKDFQFILLPYLHFPADFANMLFVNQVFC
jgi:hypothetical protein